MLGPRIDADVAVRHDEAISLEIHAFRCRNMDDLLFQRPGLDRHVAGDARHLVELVGRRPADIDHNRRADFGAVCQPHAGNPAGLLQDFGHARVEPEACAFRFRRAAQVMRRELRIGDVAGGRPEDRRLDRAAGRFAESGIVHAFGRRMAGKVELRQPAQNGLGVPIFIRNIKFIAVLLVFTKKIVRINSHDQGAALDETRQAGFIGELRDSPPSPASRNSLHKRRRCRPASNNAPG